MEDNKEVRLLFSQSTYNRLKRYADKVGVCMTHIVRIAVRDYLDRKGGLAK